VLVRLARLLLVVALLGAWQSALVHTIEHVDEAGQLVHLGDGSHRSADVSCDALAALTACAPQASAVPQVFASSCNTPINPACPVRLAEAPPFLSQGPPAAV
jgi:hypothetical protein